VKPDENQAKTRGRQAFNAEFSYYIIRKCFDHSFENAKKAAF
jgi:hypothetical protein